MKFRSMKKLIAAAMAAAMTVGSVSVAPPVEVMAEEGTPAISAQVAADTKGMKVMWNKLENESVTGYRVYRKEAGNTVSSDNGELIATLDNEGNSAKTWKYDFGLDKTETEEGEIISYVAEGYTGVSSLEDAIYSDEKGYGFTEGVPTAAAGSLAFSSKSSELSTDILNGDFVTIQGNLVVTGAQPAAGESYMEFVQKLPKGKYVVKVTSVGRSYTGVTTTPRIWIQGIDSGRTDEQNIKVFERVVDVTDGKLVIQAGATGGGSGDGTAALSAVTITEIPNIKTGIDIDGSFYCNDVTADASKKYTYKVIAMKGENEAADLNSGAVQPVVAPSVFVSATTINGATLEIDNNEVDTGSYNIYRKKASDDTFTKIEFNDIQNHCTPSKLINEKQVYLYDDFNSYTVGNEANKDDTRPAILLNQNLIDDITKANNGGWTVANVAKNWYSAMVYKKGETVSQFFNQSGIANYDGSFIYLAMAGDTLDFHKKLTNAASLNERTRLKFNFALPDFFVRSHRGVRNCCLYLADKEIAENDAANGYIAKLEYSADDNKIYLNDTEIYDFGTGTDAVRSKWNTITLDVNPEAKTISYKFEREAEDYVKRGSVVIPDAPQEPATQEGETEEPSYATLSFTSAIDADSGQSWASIAIDNLKFASTEEVDGPSKIYTYTDTNLDANTEYNYYVGAVVGGKEVVKSATVNAKTQPIAENSIALSEDNLKIKKGDSSPALTVTFDPENTSIKTITWSSSNSSVATVDNNGVVKGVGAGTATITATSKNDKKATCEVTVTDVRILDESNKATGSINLKIGKEHKLKAEVRPTASITDQNVTWKSDNTAVATVDAQGNVKAIAAGRATITVTAAHAEETATRTVVVTKENVTGITLSPASSGTLKTGGSVTLTAKVEPSDATYQDVTWDTSNNKVATVDKGVVKAVGVGTADITVKSVDDPNITATYKLTVEPATVPADKVTLSGSGIKKGKVTLNKGKSLKVTATMNPANSTDTLTWSTSKKSVATVDNGTIKAVGKGSAKITVTTTSGRTASITVTVKVPATKVTISGKGVKKKKATLKIGQKLNLTAKVKPSGSSDKVKWSTNKKKVAAIKKTKKGVTVTAKKKGKAVITAKAGKKSAKVTITVK